jgi:hypothetical protein
LVPHRNRVARAALVAAAALLVWGTAIFLLGGIRLPLFGAVVSARNPERPIALAALLVVISFFMDRGVVSGFGYAALRDGVTWMRAAAERLSRPAWGAAWALAIAIFVLGVTLGSRAASGADSSGYVSQASLWAKGELMQTVPLATAVPWPYAVSTFAPLGYTPAPSGPRIVPSYPSGLPIIMAIFRAIGGHQAVFLVVPICAAALILLTYGLGLRLSTPLGALAATLLMASAPVLLFMAQWPMSDVPVTTFWIAALLLAMRPVPRPIGSGVLTGIAVMIRPNLAPLAIVPLVLVAVAPAPSTRVRLARAAIAAAAMAPFAIAVAAINSYLYGGPLKFGYGAGHWTYLYSLNNVGPNVRHYTGWLFETQGPLVALMLIAIPVQLLWRSSAARRALIAFVAVVVASYLPYLPFDVWWYLRFLLPMLPIVYVLAADLVVGLTSRFSPMARTIAVAIVVLAVAGHSLVFAFKKDIFGVGEGEQRYAEIGRFVRDELSRKAVILAMQHGGSIRYYAGSVTIRYDLLTVARLDQAVELLRGLGYGPYLVLEDWEEPVFRERFKEHQTVKTLDSRLLAILDSNTSVRIYDLSSNPVPAIPRSIRHIPRTVCPGRWDE